MQTISSAPEPDTRTPHQLSGPERERLVRALQAHGVWPIVLPGLFEREKATKPKRAKRVVQPWEVKAA